MGCVSPVPGDATPTLVAEIVATRARAGGDELARRGSPFRGCLYAGLMLTADGPRVLEFNAASATPRPR